MTQSAANTAASAGPSGLDWAIFFSCVAVWGTAFAGLKIAVAEIPPAWVACGRMLIAAAFMAALLPLLRQKPPPLSDQPTWIAYGLIGVIGTAVPFVLFANAAAQAPSAIVAICNGGSPFFTALLAHVFLSGERLTAQRALSVGLGFAGLCALVAPGLLAPNAKTAETLGVLAAITGALCYAISNIQVKRAPPLPAATATMIYCVAGALATLPFALLTAPLPHTASPSAWTIVALLGVFSTALGGMGYVFLVQRRGPVFTSFATYLMPLWALGVGVLFLGERPGLNAFIALALILAGLVLFNARWPRPAKGQHT